MNATAVLILSLMSLSSFASQVGPTFGPETYRRMPMPQIQVQQGSSVEYDCDCKSRKKDCGIERMILSSISANASSLEAAIGDEEFENSETIQYSQNGRRAANGYIQYSPGRVNMRAFLGKTPTLELGVEIQSLSKKVGATLKMENGRDLDFTCKKRDGY